MEFINRKYLPEKKKLQSATGKAFKFPLFSMQENATCLLLTTTPEIISHDDPANFLSLVAANKPLIIAIPNLYNKAENANGYVVPHVTYNYGYVIMM